MANSLELSNGRQWGSRSAARAHFKTMLAKYRNGSRIANPADELDLRALIEHYDSTLPPGMEKKAGCGISHFTRDLGGREGWTSDRFYVHRIDGSRIDFNYVEAVSASAATACPGVVMSAWPAPAPASRPG